MLFKQFLEEECSDYVYNLLREALNEWKDGMAPFNKHFEFNRFEITFDSEKQIVMIEDVLDSTDSGYQEIQIEEFDNRISFFKKNNCNS